jgi:hypothetical protein
MKYIFVVLALLGSIFIAPNKASAVVSDGTILTADIMSPLVAWVSEKTHVKITAAPIATASGRILKTALGLEGEQQARSMAAYLPGQIIINNIIWDPESLRAESYIVHELVHHAQLLSGRSYACHEAKEREAYTLQNQWLAEHGEDPIVTESWIERMSACPSAPSEKVAMD